MKEQDWFLTLHFKRGMVRVCLGMPDSKFLAALDISQDYTNYHRIEVFLRQPEATGHT